MASGRSPTRHVWLVLVLFAASGCAALIYEITWYQLLQLALGSTAISLGVLLASFMGGLCLGSYFLPRYADTHTHPLRVYAAIEIGIGACGLLVLWLLPLMAKIYFASEGAGLPSMLLRGALAALCLLPPTILMGASLPAISRFVKASPLAASLWGWLYAGNTLGAVVGALTAAFVLLRLFDVGVASYAAVAINLIVALASWKLAERAPITEAAPAAPAPANDTGEALWPVTLTIALSGMTALGAEVVWTRLLGMMFAGTVYAFAIILAVFLIGMAAGSAIVGFVLRVVRPRLALGISQLLLAGAIAWAAYMISIVLPTFPAIESLNGWKVAGGDLLRAGMALLPAALLWGASFPLAMAAAAGASSDPARPVGLVYAANTLGGIVGALVVSLVLIVSIGARDTERALLIVAALSGVVLLLPEIRRAPSLILKAGTVAALAGALVLAFLMPQQSAAVVAYGPDARDFSKDMTTLEVVEGMNSTVAITHRNDGITEISVAGHVEASDQIADMRLQRMVGHLPALLHPNPVKILGIGFGAGVSAGSFTNYPSVKSITVCEIEPAIPPTSSKHFAVADNNIYHDPRFHVVYDDARHYIMTTKETYDIIASDPLDVWVKGTASIYTEDYFRAVKAHLNPGGFFTLYVPLYQTDQTTIRSELATFFRVFPNGTVWANTQLEGQGYDLVLMGQNSPLKVDISAVQARLDRPDFAPVRVSLSQIGFDSARDLYASFAAQQSDLAGWLQGAQINTDRNLRLMYLAGWTYNADLADPLYQDILGMRKRPTNIFTGGHDDLIVFYGTLQMRAQDPARAGAAE